MLVPQEYNKNKNIGRGITSVDDQKAILQAAVRVYFGFSPIL